MGYARYDFGEHDPVKPNMPRGYAVGCKCAFRGCRERIDRGLGYLCFGCTKYFCGKHQAAAVDTNGDLIEFDCILGAGTQCCAACAKEAEAEAARVA